MTALSIRGLSVIDAHGRRLVDDVSLTVPKGGVLTVIGETGGGKSLVAQAVFGLLPQELSVTGTIIIGNATIDAGDSRQLARFWREQIMLIPQEPSAALDPTMRVGRQMELAGLAAAHVPASLADVDLSPEIAAVFPFSLSGGMAQRVLVATALGVGAPIVVADEPTKGLDSERVDQTIAVLAGLVRAGRSMLVITHDPAVARGLGGDIAIMRAGHLVEQGPALQVLAAPTTDYGRAWVAADTRNWSPCRRCCDMGSLALSAHELTFAWPGKAPLFQNLDLHVPRGGVLAVTGPSGCGKSSLGNVLLGLLSPMGGTVEWAGENISAAVPRLRQRYQKLHQDPMTAFAPQISVGGQLKALEKVKPGLTIDRDLPPLLERLRLRPELLTRLPNAISGGEAQRLALARLLLLDPAVIVADEPTSRLDPVVQKETMDLLRAMVDERRMGLVLISHDRAMTEAVADEILRLG
jgi:peptide/nickel transport system ATP-binding protein